MHEITRKVRQMYEKYPYPLRSPGAVQDVFPDLLLSYLERPAPPPRPLQVLDAGCGTGFVCLGTALGNPHAQVTAIDLNREALAQVRAEADQLGLKNLQVEEVDLMTLQGLCPPPGGYDVIVSSGVLHHLPDPQEGLNRLASHLSPGGVMRVMVYNRWGRQGLYRFVAALDQLYPQRELLEERLVQGRKLMAGLPNNPANRPPFEGATEASDIEFVDRYLHFQDRSYEVSEFLDVVKGAGLRFLRWWEPRQWSLEAICPDPEQRAQLSSLPRERIWAAVELLTDRPQLDLYLARAEAQDRLPPTDFLATRVALSPEVTLRTMSRMMGPALFSFPTEVCLRNEPPRNLDPLEKSIVEAASRGPIRADQLPTGPQVAATTLSLIEEEVLYRPYS